MPGRRTHLNALGRHHCTILKVYRPPVSYGFARHDDGWLYPDPDNCQCFWDCANGSPFRRHNHHHQQDQRNPHRSQWLGAAVSVPCSTTSTTSATTPGRFNAGTGPCQALPGKTMLMMKSMMVTMTMMIIIPGRSTLGLQVTKLLMI